MFEEFFRKIICYLFGKIIEVPFLNLPIFHKNFFVKNFPASDLTFNKWNGVVHKKNLLIRSEFIDNLGASIGKNFNEILKFKFENNRNPPIFKKGSDWKFVFANPLE